MVALEDKFYEITDINATKSNLNILLNEKETNRRGSQEVSERATGQADSADSGRGSTENTTTPASVLPGNARNDLSGVPGVGENSPPRTGEEQTGGESVERGSQQEVQGTAQAGVDRSQQDTRDAQEEARGADLNDDNPFTEDGNNQEVGEVPFQFGNRKERFRAIDPSTYKKLIKRLQTAFPNRKVFVDADKMKRRLERLGYNVQALFGNEVMAFNPQTKRLLERAKKLNQQGKTARETREETGWFIGLDGNWRYAIDDSNARLLEDEKRIASLAKNKTVDTAKRYPLKGVLSHLS